MLFIANRLRCRQALVEERSGLAIFPLPPADDPQVERSLGRSHLVVQLPVQRQALLAQLGRLVALPLPSPHRSEEEHRPPGVAGLTSSIELDRLLEAPPVGQPCQRVGGRIDLEFLELFILHQNRHAQLIGAGQHIDHHGLQRDGLGETFGKFLAALTIGSVPTGFVFSAIGAGWSDQPVLALVVSYVLPIFLLPVVLARSLLRHYYERMGPARYYVGVASGGVWKTVNAGTTWTPVFDNEASYSTGAIVLDPKNPLVVWVGTGENNSQRSVSYGDGLYRSDDGGRTWRNGGLKTSEHIGRIAIDPKD